MVVRLKINEMEHLEFTFLERIGNQVFYKSSKLLNRGFERNLRRYVDWDYDVAKNTVKDEYKHLIKKDGFDIICISNANTHAERLAFAGLHFKNTYGRLNLQIEGTFTMMIHGGDANSCWSDETYLRLIARHNGYSQNMVTINY